DTVARRFGIEADIIQDRVRKTREAAKQNEIRSAHSGPRYDNNGPSALPAAPSGLGNSSVIPGSSSVIPGNSSVIPSEARGSHSITEPSERELLGFILRHGCTELKFESDSEFYDKDNPQTVAEFIDAALSGDSTEFSNAAYQDAYDAYFELYDRGMDQDSIVKSLLDGENRTVAAVVADLATEKYELTVHNFSDALTTTDSWLVTYVPRAILAYHDKRLSAQQADINRRLAGATPEEANRLLTELGSINALKKTINIKLGRIHK
ncbi:MAG: hypothetical protein IK052_03875, partial [Bacteroidales bacterium]|nr:hypothetical protein [Bacteroidales bacterium]